MSQEDENNPDNPKKEYFGDVNLADYSNEDDFAELESVNRSLDQLRSVLDSFEQRADTLIGRLNELLHSNREIRQDLAQSKQEEH